MRQRYIRALVPCELCFRRAGIGIAKPVATLNELRKDLLPVRRRLSRHSWSDDRMLAVLATEAAVLLAAKRQHVAHCLLPARSRSANLRARKTPSRSGSTCSRCCAATRA